MLADSAAAARVAKSNRSNSEVVILHNAAATQEPQSMLHHVLLFRR